jgi:hypothetical protein
MKMNKAWIWGGVLVLAVAVAAGVLLPSFIKARSTPGSHACINNLRIIDAAKEQAAYNKELPPDADCDDPTNKAAVNQYIKGKATPICPNGGTYKYGTVTNEPSCSLFNPKDRKTYKHSVGFRL